MAGPSDMARDHSFAIGALRTDCTAVVWPDARPVLNRMLDRVTGSLLPAALSRLLDRVLGDLDGVVRIRRLRLDVDYLGQLDETALAHVLAMRIVAALRDALRNGDSDVLRLWPDQAAYFAAYIERRLALALDPAPPWAFEELGTLDHLPPERAAAEMLREFPEILVALARDAAAEADPARFARVLDEASARALVDALLDPASPRITPEALAAAVHLLDTGLRRLATAEPARAALGLTLVLLSGPGRPDVREAVRVAALATALLHLRAGREAPGPGSRRTESTAAAPADSEAAHRLPPGVLALVKKHLGEPELRRRIEAVVAGDDLPASLGEAADAAIVEAGPALLHSPAAGIGLLLPAVADLCLPDHLTPRQLHDALLSTLGSDRRERAVTDPLFAALFPLDRRDADSGDPERPAPPVPEELRARLAAETLPLLTGSGTRAWGDLALAAFAGRLPGLGASSRGYLQAQFLHTPGHLVLGDETLDLRLRGPALAIILKMAGFSGVQRKLPHLGDRLLTITLAESVP